MSIPPPAEFAIAAFRWLEYAGLLGFVGVVTVRRLAGMQPKLGWARAPIHVTLAVALVGGTGVVIGQVLTQWVGVGGGVPLRAVGPDMAVRVARVAAEALALAFCLRVGRLAVPTALLAVVLLPFGGSHAGAVGSSAGVILIDALHVFSAGIWAGGILALASLRPPGGWASGEGRALVERFARVAPLAFAITALTGLLRATEVLSDVTNLWSTSYGVVLSLKTTGVLVMLVLSWLAWRRGLPVTRIEAAVALFVLAATALLVAYPIPPSSQPVVLVQGCAPALAERE